MMYGGMVAWCMVHSTNRRATHGRSKVAVQVIKFDGRNFMFFLKKGLAISAAHKSGGTKTVLDHVATTAEGANDEFS